MIALLMGPFMSPQYLASWNKRVLCLALAEFRCANAEKPALRRHLCLDVTSWVVRAVRLSVIWRGARLSAEFLLKPLVCTCEPRYRLAVREF